MLAYLVEFDSTVQSQPTWSRIVKDCQVNIVTLWCDKQATVYSRVWAVLFL